MRARAHTHTLTQQLTSGVHQGNFLNKLSNVCSPTVTRVSAFLFAFGMIGLGIPFAAIVMRYNLLVGRVCGPRMSTFWAIYFPWIISWLFYTGGKPRSSE